MSSVSSLRCWGSHVFPVFLEMSGKSSLPCLCLRCWGRHVFPVFPEMLGKTIGDVGEDNWRCWGRQEHWERHSRLSGRTSRRMGMTLGRSGMMGEDIRNDGEDIGEVREDEEDIAGLPCLCLEMSWKPCLPYLP